LGKTISLTQKSPGREKGEGRGPVKRRRKERKPEKKSPASEFRLKATRRVPYKREEKKKNKKQSEKRLRKRKKKKKRLTIAQRKRTNPSEWKKGKQRPRRKNRFKGGKKRAKLPGREVN